MLEAVTSRPTGAGPLAAEETGTPDTSDGGWEASLSLRLGRRAGRTRVLRCRHQGPLRIQRAFHCEPDGTAHVVVLHPPGGLVGGDRLELSAEIGPEARCVLTTAGAAKAYRSRGPRAHAVTRLVVEAGADLEYVPQETIVFDGAALVLATTIELDVRSRFLGWEIVCLGRPAGERPFLTGHLRLAWEVRRGGALVLVERGQVRGRTTGGDELLEAPHGFGGHPAYGTLVATTDTLGDVRAALAEERSDQAPAAATQLGELVVVRVLGCDGTSVRRRLERVRHRVRDAWQRPRIDPAVWRT